jgi:16S rRNA (guanine966-N2)-methyltransferase
VRVIAGTARGRALRAVASTRPTADLIKGVIFSMLEALAYKRGFEPDDDGRMAAAVAWPRVLDLFAGSGALGIEALSRGAERADFVEQDRQAAQVVQANLRATQLLEQARVHQGSAEAMLRRVRTPIDLVLADPPYAETSALTALSQPLQDLLLPTSVVVFEQAAEQPPIEVVGALPLHNTRTHGHTRISLYSTPSGGC